MPTHASLFVHHLLHRHFSNRIFYVFYFLSLKSISLQYVSLLGTSTTSGSLDDIVPFILYPHRQRYYLFSFIVSKIFLRYFLNLSANVLLSFLNTLNIKILFSELCLMIPNPLNTLLLA